MAGPNSPIGSRRRLGAELRRLRSRSGLTLDDVAERMTCSTSKISRLETGKGLPKVPDVRELMRIYGVAPGAEQDMLLRLVHDGREHGWWEELTDNVPLERYMLNAPGRYTALENDATTVRSFDMPIVHGLLQTEEYARAVSHHFLPNHSGEEIDRLVELRILRQHALRRVDPAPLAIIAVMDEMVLNRRVGSTSIMKAQLEHLHDVAGLPNVSIRILPFDAGILRAHAGQFVLLEIPTALGSDVVFIEGHAGNNYLDVEADVDRYREVHDDALRHALSTDESRAVIARYLNRHGSNSGASHS